LQHNAIVPALSAQLLNDATVEAQQAAAVQRTALRLARSQRAALRAHWIDRFLQQYGLHTAKAWRC